MKAKIVSFDMYNMNYKIILNCSYEGFPEPRAQFFHDGREIDEKTPILVQRNYSYIILEKQTIYQESFYNCKVSNRWSKDSSLPVLVSPSGKPDQGKA